MAGIRETKESPMEDDYTEVKGVTHVSGVVLIGCNQGPTGISVLDTSGIRALTQLSIEAPPSSPIPTTQGSSLPSQQPGSRPLVWPSMQQSAPPLGIRLAGSGR